MWHLAGENPSIHLRQDLQRLTDELVGDRLGEQASAVSALCPVTPHEIEIAEAAVLGRSETFWFNCFEYALEIADHPEAIARIGTLYTSIFPNSEFMRLLLETRLQPLPRSQVATGTLVLYLQGDTFRHAGRVSADRIVSKWGTGHLWRHGLFEVPASYGDKVRFFRPLARGEAIAGFIAYAELKLGHAVVAKVLGGLPAA